MTKFYVALLSFAFLSCSRDTPKDDQQNSPSRVIEKVPLWVDRQIKLNQPLAEKIHQLKENLDLANARLEQDGSKKILLVPIKKQLVLLNNKDKEPANYLLLYLNAQYEISSGRIVQYIGAQKELPPNTIAKLLNSKDLKCDGSFTFLNIADKFLFEFKYAAGKKKDFVYMKTKERRAAAEKDAQVTLAPNCHDWYLITTHYNSDGSVEVWEDYLGRTCDDCAPATKTLERSVCAELVNEAGGGAEDDCCIASNNAVLTSEAISEKAPDECGLEAIDPASGLLTKTCLYKWYYNSSSLLWYSWKYQSVETAVLEKYGANWKFKNIAHTGRLVEGNKPVNCINVTDEHYATASISADRSQAKMIINATISVSVSCTPWASPATKSLSAYCVWNAA